MNSEGHATQTRTCRHCHLTLKREARVGWVSTLFRDQECPDAPHGRHQPA